MVAISIPKEYANRRRLMAVPEQAYRQFRAFISDEHDEISDLKQSLAEARVGQVIRAASATEALKEARDRGWLD